MCHINQIKEVRTLLNASRTTRKICDMLSIQVLNVSHGLLNIVKNELADVAKSGQRAAINSLPLVPQTTTLAQSPDASLPNQKQMLQRIPGTINRSFYLPYDGLTSQRDSIIPLSTKQDYHILMKFFFFEENENQNAEDFSLKYSNFRPPANQNSQVKQISLIDAGVNKL
ncbi:hypothetical protein RF11_03713 [Thelohanellus kitauei]|uniref:Uncharacterized protein n=1 Tax=Thelohanellus kitauei TaxID=669202 RepID=A0A0C2J0I1_THEKT|nr:hypothetical protein RF11_03713 [Thelohanellus kitauei]